jgi:hypothetical protein
MSFITLALFLGSLAGIVFIIHRKIPLLLMLPQQGETRDLRSIVVSSARGLAADKVLQKALTKTRTAALKTETRTGEWLEKLRSRSNERKEEFSQSYWDQFRKGKSKKED